MASLPPAPSPPSRRLPPYAWNYSLLAVDGGLFMGGMAFVAPITIGPLIIKELGGPTWVMAFMPTFMIIGFSLPQLFVAHWIEQLKQLKPWLVYFGIFQRLPYFLAALALLFLAERAPLLTVATVALAPLVSGLVGGLNASAFFEFYIRSVPSEKRASLNAVRQSIKDIIGLFAGGLVFTILAAVPGTTGFGVLHLITFVALMLSWLMFLMMREPGAETATARPVRSLADNLQRVPALVRAQLGLRRFILARVFGAGMFLAIPFLVIAAQEKLDATNALMGTLISWQMAGGLLGNFLGGWWGDRFGSRSVAIASIIAFLATALLAFFAFNYLMWAAVFVCLGMHMSWVMIGMSTLSMDLFEPKDRPTSQAVSALAATSALIAVGFVGGWLQRTGGLPLTLIMGILAAVGSGYFLWRIPEPRNTAS